MPGAGVNASNIGALREATGASEFHASAKEMLASKMSFKPNRLADMHYGETRSDAREIRKLRTALKDKP